MRTPFITIFVVCILVVAIPLLFYDYKKHGARPQSLGISRTEADRLRETRESGAEQSYKENYEDAIEKYERALKISPRDAYLHNDLGTAYYRLGLESMEPPMLEEEFGFGIEVDARHLEGSKPLERVEEALRRIESGIITAVVNDEATNTEIERYARSLDHYAHVEEEETEDNDREFWLTIVTGRTKELFLKAEREYLKAIDIKSVKDANGRKYSNYSTASRNLGTLYFRMGRKKDAIAQWRRALQIEPTDAELRNLLGEYE
jgi:tetratricopeptide (TPR) repeat protein